MVAMSHGPDMATIASRYHALSITGIAAMPLKIVLLSLLSYKPGALLRWAFLLPVDLGQKKHQLAKC